MMRSWFKTAKQEISTPESRSAESLALINPVAEEDFKWFSQGANGFIESQTWYCFLDNGAYLLFQIGMSDLGFSATGQTTVRYFDPSQGHDFFKVYTYSGKDFHFMNGKTSIRMKNKIIVDLITESDTTKRGHCISFKEKEVELDLKYVMVNDGLKIGDGLTYYGGVNNEKFIRDWFSPKVDVSGTIKLDGRVLNVTGHGYLLATYQAMKPHEAAESYQFVTFQSENISLSMVQTFPPKSDQIINSGIFHFDDYTAISVNPVMTFQESSVCSESGYVIPTKVEFRWNGKTIEDDQDYEVTLNVEIDERFTKKVDVLAEVPYLLRKVIQMLVAKPYVYQTMQEVEVTCRIGDRVMQEKGRIFFEFAFITGRGPIPN